MNGAEYYKNKNRVIYWYDGTKGLEADFDTRLQAESFLRKIKTKGYGGYVL